MPEIRCPMCSKPNPEENEVCQFCQARLKPLIAGQAPEETSQERPDPGTDRSRQERQPHPPPPTSSPTEDLSRLRSEYEELLPDLFPSEENEFEAAQEPSSESTYDEPESSDEYLGRLGGSEDEGEPQTLQPQDADTPSDEEGEPVPGWLERIRQKEDARTKDSQPLEEEGSDWLTRLREKEGTQEDQAETDQDQPDMDAMDASPVELESPSFEQASEEVEVGLPSDLPVSEAESLLEASPESGPDWLSQSISTEEEEPTIESAEPDEMLGWLAEARQ